MKKFVVILIMIAGSFLIGCFGDDDEFSSASLKYKNNQSGASTIADIRWTSNGSVNQTWSDTLDTIGEETASKTVTVDTAHSECVADGVTSFLEYDNGSDYSQTLTLSDGSTNTFSIDNVTTVKK